MVLIRYKKLTGGIMVDCKLGIETFKTVFHWGICSESRCLSLADANADISSADWIAYNETLCAAAEGCKKVCNYAFSFFECVNTNFCEQANSTVRAVADTVYQLNKERAAAAAMELLPIAAVAVVGSLAAGALIESYAPKNKISGACIWISRGITALGAIGLAHVAEVNLRN